MTRNLKSNRGNTAYREAVAVHEQFVELGAVAREIRTFVEYLSEDALNGADLSADGELPPSFS